MSRRKSSFFLAMRLLGRRRRRAMFALYGFCRIVDDIADEGSETAAQRLERLEEWRRCLDGLYDGEALSSVMGASVADLASAVAAFDLPKADLLAVLDGMTMDAQGLMRRPSADCLDLYCDRVAAAVGRLTLRIFGLEGPDMDELASALGSALQRTNILRDLAEDAARGRLYLPDDLLSAEGITGDDPLGVLDDPALPRICAAMAARARRDYGRANAIMAARRCRILRSAGLMAAVYVRQLNRLESAGWRSTARIGRMMKLILAIRWVLHPHPWNDAALLVRDSR